MTLPLGEVSSWIGLLTGMDRPRPTITLRAPRMRAHSSGAGAFLGLADDGAQYWFKLPGNPQGNQVLANEIIVEEVGRLIGAPVRQRALAWVPASMTRWGHSPVPSSDVDLVAHASQHLPNAVDNDEMVFTRRDDNARRQATMMVLWDLCVGEDPQWLYETTAAYSIWSYDHGLWFTTGEGDWTREVLEGLVEVDGSYASPPPGYSRSHLRAVAKRVESLTQEELLRAVSMVPVEWVPDQRDLEVMAWFLDTRAPAVAERARRLAANDPTPRTESRP